MKKKQRIIIFILLVIIIILSVILGYVIKNKFVECEPFTGGMFKIIYETNGDGELENQNVCIACSPDSYEDILVPTKEGYNFVGWYYDKELTKEVKVTNTMDITPVDDIKDGCKIGYKDITLYAKWEE